MSSLKRQHYRQLVKDKLTKEDKQVKKLLEKKYGRKLSLKEFLGVYFNDKAR